MVDGCSLSLFVKKVAVPSLNSIFLTRINLTVKGDCKMTFGEMISFMNMLFDFAIAIFALITLIISLLTLNLNKRK
jgi:hypothetical protein